MPKRLSPPFRIVVALAMGLNLMAWSSVARADFWGWVTDLVTEPSDHVPEEVSLGKTALPPDAIVTAPGEVRIIELGRDILELYPSTAVTVKASSGNVTTVQVITGTVRATVAKRKSQTFRIETPMLVGTVKGTVFEVSTTTAASAVSVHEGRVAVKAKHGIGGVDVTPGRTATVTAGDRDPSLGKTPHGGAAAATKALSRRATPSTASATDDQPDEDNKGNDRSREQNRSDRAPTGGGSRPGGSGGPGSGGGDDSGEGGEGGDGEGGEGGDGEGGEGEGGEGGDGEGGEGGDDD
jgi:FecR protein